MHEDPDGKPGSCDVYARVQQMMASACSIGKDSKQVQQGHIGKSIGAAAAAAAAAAALVLWWLRRKAACIAKKGW